MNYSELQTTIRDYTEVEDTVLGSTTLGTIVQNAENRVFRDANIDAYRQYAVSNMVVGQRYVSVPSGLRNIRYVQVTDSSGEQQFLEQKDTSFMAEYDSTPSTTYGFPKYYANWDSNTWVVAPTPSSTSQITIAYYAQPTSITTTSNATSYVSENAQDLLIYASLVETYKFLKGPADMIQLYEQSYQQALQSFGVEQTGRRRRDEYTDGVVRVPLQSVDPSK
tara:strand:- start:2942 stop:3607 length:666 start_codon:yes stop_codon:yes gene_type:complete